LEQRTFTALESLPVYALLKIFLFEIFIRPEPTIKDYVDCRTWIRQTSQVKVLKVTI